MASVDDRIVRMEFDNAAFERKIDTTLSSLAQLDKALKFDGAKQGFSDISASADKVHLGGIGDAVQGISAKFLALSTIGITALATITSKAISAGASIVKSLSLDQIISGFKEYELNIGSIQTILSNTKADGTNLQQVNSALDELNTYADKTIYNFGQMTKNIGTFTAAGVDLNTSVQSIKGISNLAAISGSSADQASTAMYQLSQAVSTGTLKLMDWNSVVNAGMGGEVFQKALFETGKAMHTIKDAKLDTTFEQWTKSGHSFRESLQEGWITSDVLTTTLANFTGEMTDAQLAAKGFSKEQIANIKELGATGVDAATKVRTLTQLIDTTKEAIGSGWSESFRIIIGNFTEATTLFTSVSNAIGKMVSKSADARNKLLQGWKDLGGRTLLIDTLKRSFQVLGSIVKTVSQAFHDIFPAMTSKRLFDITKGFSNLVDALKPSSKTLNELKSIFRGFFSIIEIGWTIIKSLVRVIGELFAAFTGAGSGAFLEFAAKVGDFFTTLGQKLVAGGAIKDFFNKFEVAVYNVGQVIKTLIGLIVDFFKHLGDSKAVDIAGGAVDRLGQRFQTLKDAFGRIKDLWKPFSNALDKIMPILDRVWDAIKNWFSELGDKLAAVMGPGDFTATLDAINTGLLGGITLLIAKWLKGGIKVDVGDGMFASIKKSFDGLTGVLSAMQTQIKADALLKIAGAVGILTVSVVALSMIDSAALTKALSAMAVGFGQLLGAFYLLNQMDSGLKSAATFTTIALGLTLLAGAMVIMAVAVKILGSLSWDQIARGLTSVTLLMGIMIATTKLIDSGSLIRAGLGMIGIALAINIMAGAVKLFSMMSWGELAKGFGAVAAGLLIIAGAMQLMPPTLPLTALGLIGVAIALNILAGALKVFATMSWGEMAKGMVGIAGGLLIIAGAMQLMPPTMPLMGAGLILVSISLIAIAKAMQMMGGMSWGAIAKGLVAMAGALLILAVAANAMSSAIAGAVAIAIVSASLLLLAQVIKQLAGLSWGDLLKGLAGIALVFVVLGGAAFLLQPVIPALLALGAALLVVGAALTLFGIGAYLVARAFQILADSGTKGAKGLHAALLAIGAAIPLLMAGFAEGLVQFAMVFIKFAPVFAKALVVVLGHILDGLVKLIPKVLVIIGQLISGILKLIRDKYPELIKTGISMILALLTGIKNNIGKVVELVGEIIVQFLGALGKEIPRIVAALGQMLVDIFEGVARTVGYLSSTILFGVGSAFIQGFLDGVIDSASSGPMKWFTEFVGKVLGWIGDALTALYQKGVDLVTGLFNGIKSLVGTITGWFGAFPGNVIRWIGNVVSTLYQKGIDLITGIFNGIKNKALEVITWFAKLPANVVIWIGNVVRTLWNKGSEILGGFLSGVISRVAGVTSWFGGLASAVVRWIGNVSRTLWNVGWSIVEGFWTGVWDNFVKIKDWFANIGSNVKNAIGDVSRLLFDIGKDIINSLWNGMKDVWGHVTGWVGDLAGHIADLKGPPKKDKVLLVENGSLIMQGLQRGMEDEWDNVSKWLSEVNPADSMDQNMGNNMAGVINGAISDMVSQIESIGEFNPVITPVLDLTRVAEESKQIGGYIQAQDTIPGYSYVQAQNIASSATEIQDQTLKDQQSPGQVNFQQNIYAPEQLSTADIYKQTRNQITMAKEELSIP